MEGLSSKLWCRFRFLAEAMAAAAATPTGPGVGVNPRREYGGDGGRRGKSGISYMDSLGWRDRERATVCLSVWLAARDNL